MNFFMLAIVYAFVMINTCLTAPHFIFDETSIDQLSLFNLTSNLTSTPGRLTPFYEVFEIPETDLNLHLTILVALDGHALHSCLQTGSIWVSYQRRSAIMPRGGFDWEDPAGAAFYIRSLSQHLTWADLKDILSGMKEAFVHRQRYFTSSFTVEQRSTQMFIAQGRLSKYTPPDNSDPAELSSTPGPDIATA